MNQCRKHECAMSEHAAPGGLPLLKSVSDDRLQSMCEEYVQKLESSLAKQNAAVDALTRRAAQASKDLARAQESMAQHQRGGGGQQQPRQQGDGGGQGRDAGGRGQATFRGRSRTPRNGRGNGSRQYEKARAFFDRKKEQKQRGSGGGGKGGGHRRSWY